MGLRTEMHSPTTLATSTKTTEECTPAAQSNRYQDSQVAL